MIKKCKKCGLEVDTNKYKRCPRCNSIIDIPKKCGECKGCGLHYGNKEGKCC